MSASLRHGSPRAMHGETTKPEPRKWSASPPSHPVRRSCPLHHLDGSQRARSGHALHCDAADGEPLMALFDFLRRLFGARPTPRQTPPQPAAPPRPPTAPTRSQPAAPAGTRPASAAQQSPKPSPRGPSSAPPSASSARPSQGSAPRQATRPATQPGPPTPAQVKPTSPAQPRRPVTTTPQPTPPAQPAPIEQLKRAAAVTQRPPAQTKPPAAQTKSTSAQTQPPAAQTMPLAAQTGPPAAQTRPSAIPAARAPVAPGPAAPVPKPVAAPAPAVAPTPAPSPQPTSTPLPAQAVTLKPMHRRLAAAVGPAPARAQRLRASGPDARRWFSATMRTRARPLRGLEADEAQLARYGLPVWRTEADVAQALDIDVRALRHFRCTVRATAAATMSPSQCPNAAAVNA